MSNNNDFAQFIDELRESRNISRDDFVEGVISLRQYYRFIKGESSIKSESLSILLERIEINTVDAYNKFLKSTNAMNNRLTDIYEYIFLGDYIQAKIDFEQVSYDTITTIKNRKLFKFIQTTLEIYNKKTSRSDGVDKIIEIIDYPNILNKKMLSYLEITGIMYISDDLIKREDLRIPEYSYALIQKDIESNFKTIRNSSFPFYSMTSKGLGSIGEIEKSITVASQGIRLFHLHNGFSILASLYYIKAVGELKLYKDNHYTKTLHELFSLMFIMTNETFVGEMKHLVKRNFEVEQDDLITYK